MSDPHALFDGPVADPLIAGDHDESLAAHHWEPIVVQTASGDIGEGRVPGVDNVVMLNGERPAEGEVVLIDEEPGRHLGLCREGALLFLVGDSRLDQVLRQLIAVGDGRQRFAGVKEFPESLRCHSLDCGPAEAQQRIDHNR